jgi:hypothetical protein
MLRQRLPIPSRRLASALQWPSLGLGLFDSSPLVELRHWGGGSKNMSAMSPEFIAIITVGVAHLAGLLTLGLFLGQILREIFLSTRIDVLQGRRIEGVLRELR